MQPLKWLTIILVYTVLTLLCVYLIPADSFFSLVRVVFAFVFVVFMPGYCLINLLFAEGKLDFAEALVLSVALSFSVAGISGLFLGISSFGLTVSSITSTLSSIVFVLALLAFLKKSGYLTIQFLRTLKNKTKMASSPTVQT